MNRIERILTNARRVLSDKDAERWTDDDLLALLDEGHKDLCQHARILKAQASAYLTIDSADFDLPDDCWQLTRAAYNKSVLPFTTHTELDTAYVNADASQRSRVPTASQPADWQVETGSPEAIIYDRRNMTAGKVYPIPTDDDLVPASFSSPFGVVVDSPTGDLNSVFGVTTDGTDPFGIATDITIEPSILCYYLQIPQDIESTDDELKTPIMFDTALKYYVIGNAFLMDIAEEYQAKGLQQLGFYNRELELADKTSARDHQRAAASRTTYRTGF